MRFISKASIVVIAILALTVCTAGQQAPAKQLPAKPPAPEAQKKDVPKYKMADEVKWTGTVAQVKNYECPISGRVGTHLVVKIDSQKYEAHIAPLKFLEEYSIHFKEGDTITLFATKVKFGEGTALLVRAIERENDQFFFRDKEGLPIWQ